MSINGIARYPNRRGMFPFRISSTSVLFGIFLRPLAGDGWLVKVTGVLTGPRLGLVPCVERLGESATEQRLVTERGPEDISVKRSLSARSFSARSILSTPRFKRRSFIISSCSIRSAAMILAATSAFWASQASAFCWFKDCGFSPPASGYWLRHLVSV